MFIAEPVDLRVLTLPDNLDPCDFLLARGQAAFEELLGGAATDALEHKFRPPGKSGRSGAARREPRLGRRPMNHREGAASGGAEGAMPHAEAKPDLAAFGPLFRHPRCMCEHG